MSDKFITGAGLVQQLADLLEAGRRPLLFVEGFDEAIEVAEVITVAGGGVGLRTGGDDEFYISLANIFAVKVEAQSSGGVRFL